MKKILSCLTVATLLTSSTTNLVSFQTKLNNLNKDIRIKTKTTIKNSVLKNNNLKQENQNQAKANAIMSRLNNKLIKIINYTKKTYAYQYNNEIQWALNEIASQKDTPYTFYFANTDGNKVLTFLSPRKIYIGVEVNGVKCDVAHQANIQVILSNISIDDVLKDVSSKINNAKLTIARITNQYTLKDYINQVKQNLTKISNPKSVEYVINWINNNDYNKVLNDNYQSFNIKISIDGIFYSTQLTINIKVAGETDQQKAKQVADAWYPELTLKWIPSDFAYANKYTDEMRDAIKKLVPTTKNIDFKIICINKYSNIVLNEKFQSIGMFVQVGKMHSYNFYTNIKIVIPKFSRTKEAIETAPAVITQNYKKEDLPPAEYNYFIAVHHITRPTLLHNDDWNGYWASFNIYVNWYNIHWACQTEGNFWVNILKHFINYSGYSIAQAVQPAAWENCPPDHTINWTPTYTNHVEKISPFDDSSLTKKKWVGALGCPAWWAHTFDSAPNFYDDLPDQIYDTHYGRSAQDIKNTIYSYAAHAPKGSHGVKFQLSFALQYNTNAEPDPSRVFLGDGNCQFNNNTDLPIYW